MTLSPEVQRVLLWLTSLAISAVGAALWMTTLTRADPNRKAKNHHWVRYIIAGAASVYLAMVFYILLYFITGGGFRSPYAAANDFWYVVLINGPAEEWAKFLVFWMLAKGFGRVKEPRDGVLVAMMVALGFSFWENIQYILVYGPASIPSRLIWASSGHMAYAAVWGYFGGQMILEPPEGRGLRRSRYVLAAVFVVSFVHGMFNFLITWVGSGAGFVLDILMYLVTLILLAQACRGTSAYAPHAVADARKAIPRVSAALRRDPRNPVLHRRLGFYRLALGEESAALQAWSSVPTARRDAYLRAWIAVLAQRGSRRRGGDEFKSSVAALSPEARGTLKRRLRHYLGRDADEWIRRVEDVERKRRIAEMQSVWR